MNYVKVDATTIKTDVVTEVKYDYAELLARKQSPQNSKEYQGNIYDQKIAEIDALIAECVKLGLKEPITKI